MVFVATALSFIQKLSLFSEPRSVAVSKPLPNSIPFIAGSTEVEPGLLNGFYDAEISGFQSGGMFGPMMGSIAFVGYVFDLADDADVEAFKKNLTDNANLRWQICVTADEMLCESNGDKVFFIMCPTSLEG